MKPITDLSQLDTSAAGEEGATLHLRNPFSGEPQYVVLPGGNEPVALTVTLLGSDSPTWRNKVSALQRRRLRAMQGRRNTPEPADLERDAIELLAACTVAWTGVVIDGKAPVCSPENAVMAYSRLPWMREQADEFANARENFMGESARN